MENERAFEIILAISIIGILILSIVVDVFIKPIPLEISQINKELLDQKVKTQGKITSIKETPGLYIINIEDQTDSIPIIVFKDKEPLEIIKGDFIEVEGKIIEYEDIVEIQASKIIK